MRNQLIRLFALLLWCGTLSEATSPDEKITNGKTDDRQAHRAAAQAVRSRAVPNVESIVGELDLGSEEMEKVKLKALLSDSQREQAVKSFRASGGEEIHTNAHEIIPATIPGSMQKFMPSYMRSRIMASRRAGRRGPLSRAEIARLQNDARKKIQPVIRRTLMPVLDELKQARIAELLLDEKKMPRVLADRIIEAEVPREAETRLFGEAFEAAGYPVSLTSGADAVMSDRKQKMLNALDLGRS